MDKLTLEKISQEIQNCSVCKIDSLGKAVVGEGNPKAKVIFMGEAPGKKEAETGRPFIGRSGQLLRKLIREILGLDDLKGVFITSPVKYLPKRGTPLPSQIKHGMIHTQKQLDITNPRVVVLLGSVAAQGVLGEKISVTKAHGKPIKKDNKTYFPTFHPAAALRFPPLKKLLEGDFKKLKEILKP